MKTHPVTFTIVIAIFSLCITGSWTGEMAMASTVFGDVDGDGDIDADDATMLNWCLTGPDMTPLPICLPADLDSDQDVDLSDYGVFQAAFTGAFTPRITDYGNSGCKSVDPPLDGGEDQYPWCGDDVVELTLSGTNLYVVHRNATYNCCPDDIVIRLIVDGNTLRFVEEEVLTMPCDCLCCYDVNAAVDNLTPGQYTVEFYWQDYETSQQQCYTQQIIIGTPPELTYYGNSGCITPDSASKDGDQYPWCGDDVVNLTASGSDILVDHRNATYNCCPEDIIVRLTVEGNVLHLEEEEILDMPCDCMCCYNVGSTVSNLTPGTYTVEYCWWDWETSQHQCHVEQVTIEPNPQMAEYGDSGCLGGAGSKWHCGDDAFTFATGPGTVAATHFNTSYNCCPDEILVSLDVQGDQLIFIEEEILTTGCFCICCYNVDSTITGLASGTYTVQYWWEDYEIGGQNCHTEQIYVP